MLVASYSVHWKNPRVRVRCPHPARYQVKIWATDGEARLEREIKNKDRCMLTDLLPAAADQIEEMIEELPAYTDAGFQVIKLR